VSVNLKKINDELHRLGHDARLERGDGYFYFSSGEANDWFDRTVKVPTLGRLTLEQWVEEFNKLKKLGTVVHDEAPRCQGSGGTVRRQNEASRA
jgi:hypothetical protein